MGIQSFAEQGTEDVFDGKDTKEGRRTCPAEILKVARRKLDQLNSVQTLEELKVPPGNQLEPLKGDRKGQHSIRINKQHRVCFEWTDAGPKNVEITDYH